MKKKRDRVDALSELSGESPTSFRVRSSPTSFRVRRTIQPL